MDWQEIWRGTVAGGREVVVHEEDEGDIRVSTTTKDGDIPITITPADDESLEDELMRQGGFTAEEAADLAQHVEDRRIRLSF